MAVPASAGTEPEGLQPGPSRQPTSHSSQSAAWTVGTLTIPAIGVDEVVRLGVDPSVLNRGVGLWAGTSEPGGEGNVVLAGHRTTYSRPFSNLDKLTVGDIVSMTDADGIDVIYRVSETMIVEPEDMWITYDHETPTLTMFACHPKGSAEKRIVVVAELVSSQRML
jgi:sortase A